MKSSFKKYYDNYLGIDQRELRSGKSVFSSGQRNIPINYKYVYKMIATFFGKNIVFSIAPKFYSEFSRFIDGKRIETFNDVMEISYDFFELRLNSFKVREMYRLTLKEDKSVNLNNEEVVPVTKALLFESIKNMNKEEKAQIWHSRRNEIVEGRIFVILKENKIVSTAKISDIDYSGGNIVVFTDSKYRNKGYGKQVVKKCIDWCLDKEILPVYLVNAKNKPSIKLAESLGFKISSKEVIVSVIL